MTQPRCYFGVLIYMRQLSVFQPPELQEERLTLTYSVLQMR